MGSFYVPKPRKEIDKWRRSWASISDLPREILKCEICRVPTRLGKWGLNFNHGIWICKLHEGFMALEALKEASEFRAAEPGEVIKVEQKYTPRDRNGSKLEGYNPDYYYYERSYKVKKKMKAG